MTQPPLNFTRTHTHASDPDTSREAARKVVPKFTEACAALLWDMDAFPSGMTYKEAVSRGHSQQRFSDLCVREDIVPNGEKRDGCRVYVVKET